MINEAIPIVIVHDSTASRIRAERLVRRIAHGLGNDLPIRLRSCRVTANNASEWVRNAAVTIVALSASPEGWSELRWQMDDWLPAMAVQPTALVFLHVLDEMNSMHAVSSTLEEIATARGISYFSSAVPRITAHTSPSRGH